MTQTQWLPEIVVLALGLVGGGIYLLASRRKGVVTPEDDTQADLEKRANTLIEQLKELNAERHHMTDERFAAEKARLETAAAAALRAKDEYAQGKSATAPATATTPPRKGFFARHPQLAGAFWGGGVVLFFVALGLFLSQDQHVRGQGMEVTGRNPTAEMGAQGQGQGQADQGDDSDFQQALAEVKKHPEEIELAGKVTHELLRREDLNQAESLTNRSLALEPFDAELRVHRAFILAAKGNVAGGRDELAKIADQYPGGYEALVFLGMLDMQTGNMPGALEDFERYAAEAPKDELPPELGQSIAMLREQVKGQK